MKVVSGDLMRLVDRRAIEEFGVPGLTLMENAGRGCAEIIHSKYGRDEGGRTVVVAGRGNNGGDGYVIARLLSDLGWKVSVFVLADREAITGDARVNLDLLDEVLLHFRPELDGFRRFAEELAGAEVIIDALLGTGLGSEVQGAYAEAIRLINAASGPVVAVDIPSGIHAGTGKVLGAAVEAELTITFALAKNGHVLYPGAAYCGALEIIDIGIPRQVATDAEGYEYVDLAAAGQFLKRRDRQTHKGSCGHTLVIAGATGRTGAAAMAANSAVRAGAGLVTLAVPASLNHILEIKTTEAMTTPVPDEGEGMFGADACELLLRLCEGKDAVALGPGISWTRETAVLVRELVAEVALPLVIDADALNGISDEPSVLLGRKAPCLVLTPHPGEMARLAGLTIEAVEADRIGTARDFSRKYGVFTVLKGARTIISTPDGEVAINGSGNPGMASGGMGDVLTGTIAALLGQGYDPFAACRLGVFVHGHAADLVARDKGEIGMSATDVQERLPWALKNISEQGRNHA